MRGALGEDAPRIDANDLGLYRGMDQQGFFDVVGDGEYGDGEGREYWNESVACVAVDASERLVKYQECGVWHS